MTPLSRLTPRISGLIDHVLLDTKMEKSSLFQLVSSGIMYKD